MPQSDLNAYASADSTANGANAEPGLYLTSTGDPNDGDPDSLHFTTVGGASTDNCVEDETALDVETAHAMAPGSNLVYWLGYSPQTASCPNNGASDTVMRRSSMPSTNTGVSIISNSWGRHERVSLHSR